MRSIAAPFVVPGPSGVSVRTRLRVSTEDEKILRLVGEHLGSLASRDLKARCHDGLEHNATRWAERKREITAEASSHWAGSITNATHAQWALSRRNLTADVKTLQTGISAIEGRLALPVGARGTKATAGGYRSPFEWFTKSRRLNMLRKRLTAAQADYTSGRVRVTRGGRRLLSTRHQHQAAGLTETEWRRRWTANRQFLSASGLTSDKYGNPTIRVKPDGEVSIRLPNPLMHLANTSHNRYVLSQKARFIHRSGEWADRIEARLAVAYRICHDAERSRWYITASWQRAEIPALTLEAALSSGCIGVDANNDHLAAWRLDLHGNPVGEPRRFFFDLTGSADHRDAQIRHALTRLLHWARRCHVSAIAVEDLDFTANKTREKHGRKAFRCLISRFPTARLRVRLMSMAAEQNIAVVAVDPAYTSKWGAQHWQKPLTTPTRKTTRHDAASIAIGRRALGYPIRRRTAPPRHHQSDGGGHRTAQAGPATRGREETRPPATDRPPRGSPPNGTRKRETSASAIVPDAHGSQEGCRAQV